MSNSIKTFLPPLRQIRIGELEEFQEPAGELSYIRRLSPSRVSRRGPPCLGLTTTTCFFLAQIFILSFQTRKDVVHNFYFWEESESSREKEEIMWKVSQYNTETHHCLYWFFLHLTVPFSTFFSSYSRRGVIHLACVWVIIHTRDPTL